MIPSFALREARRLHRLHRKGYIPLAVHASVRRGRVLVFAPHPDDETIGCGGAIMRHIARGDTVQVTIVTDGAKGVRTCPVEEYIQVRKQEARNACAALGVQTCEFLDFADQGLEISAGTFAVIRNHLRAYQPDAVYCPSLNEIHTDHIKTAALVLAAARSMHRPIQTLEYEVGNPVDANLLIDISDLIEQKIAALRCYPSQLNAQDLVDKTAGLNRYRTINCTQPSIRYIEAFRASAR